jgi:hypothetical protein
MHPLPTIFPLSIDKTEYLIIIVITNCVSRFANFLRLLSAHYLPSMHGSPIYSVKKREIYEEAFNNHKRY